MIDYEKESMVLKALGHPLRLRMVEGLMANECNVNKVCRALNLPQSTASQHLSVLKSCGIVEPRKEGVRTCYRVVDSRVRQLIDLLHQ